MHGCQLHFKSDVHNHINKVGLDERENFEKYTTALCDATTVTQYNAGYAELLKIAEKYPEIQPFLKYWDFRKSHVFGPSQGFGIPGVNMSKQANRTFKPLQRLSLVEAAKYDVATMMWQKTQISLFKWNLLRCTGRAPSQEVKDSWECSRQMKVAADFVNILDDHSAVMLEAEEGMNPVKYIKKKGTHRAPVSNLKNTLKPGGSRAVKSRKQKESVTQISIDEETLRQQCVAAMEVMDCDLHPEAGISIVKNPPCVAFAAWNIHKCKGCKKEITTEQKEYPHNMVFRRIELSGHINTTLNKWIESEQPVHFHLNMACLRKHDPTMEIRYITANDELFLRLDKVQMEVQHGIGFLKPIARKKTN